VRVVPPACSVEAVSGWTDAGAPKVGDDVSAASQPVRIPAGATLAIRVALTQHRVLFTGPAVLRPCTHEEPDLLLLAEGSASIEPKSGLEKQLDAYVATPGVVAIVGTTPLSMSVVSGSTSYDIPKGEVMLDTSEMVHTGMGKGTLPRFESAGLALSRCVSQAASSTAAARMIESIASDAGPPLPAASVAVLTVQAEKHHRLARSECGIAQAMALACDDMPKKDAACFASWASTSAQVARAMTLVDLPPGTPIAPATK
jgi:hypothetical protein